MYPIAGLDVLDYTRCCSQFSHGVLTCTILRHFCLNDMLLEYRDLMCKMSACTVCVY